MRLEELNWMDVEEYLKHEDRLMLVLGATERISATWFSRPWRSMPANRSIKTSA